MLHPKFIKDTGIEEEKNGKIRMTTKNFEAITKWREENLKSPYLFACFDCGKRTRNTEKIGNKYYTRCLECGKISEIPEVDGMAIIGF